MNFGKFRYDQSKREKENRKASHQVKIKEIKVKPNIDAHDLETKTRHARQFLLDGMKVKITCTFRGREMVHTEIGERLVKGVCQSLEDVSVVESSPKMMGRMLLVVLAPGGKKKKEGGRSGEAGDASPDSPKVTPTGNKP
jgi:translation initiation factor IF-3